MKSGSTAMTQRPRDRVPSGSMVALADPDYLTKMGIKTVPHTPYSPHLAPCDFWLFPKLRCCHEKIEDMKEAVTKLIDTLTQEDFNGALQKLLERSNKCIAAGGDYFEGDKSFMYVLSIKVPIRIKSGNLFNDPRTYIHTYAYIYLDIHLKLNLKEIQ